MKNYYKNELVKVLRTYQWHGKSKAEIQFSDGHSEIVNMSDVYLGDITETFTFEVEDSKVEISKDGIKAQSDNIEIDAEKTSNAIASNQKYKYAITNIKSGKDLAMLNESGLKRFIAKHKLDPEAIDLCLQGKQKTHKGYSFTIVDN